MDGRLHLCVCDAHGLCSSGALDCGLYVPGNAFGESQVVPALHPSHHNEVNPSLNLNPDLELNLSPHSNPPPPPQERDISRNPLNCAAASPFVGLGILFEDSSRCILTAAIVLMVLAISALFISPAFLIAAYSWSQVTIGLIMVKSQLE